LHLLPKNANIRSNQGKGRNGWVGKKGTDEKYFYVLKIIPLDLFLSRMLSPTPKSAKDTSF